MMEAISYLANHDFFEIVNILFFSITIIVVAVRAIEKMGKKLYSYFIFLYNKKRGKEVEEETIGNSIKKIKGLSAKIEELEQRQNSNVTLFTEHEIGIIERLDQLSESINNIASLVEVMHEQQKELTQDFVEHKETMKKKNADRDETDVALLRDRILGGMRYFGQNKDENGVVHIAFGDHENMDKMFAQYFGLGGNGSVKAKYENEFKKFIIND